MVEKRIYNILEKYVESDKDKEIYCYALILLWTTIISMGTIMFIGFCAGMLVSSIIYILVLMTIRTKTGGYHASSYIKCNCLGNVTYIAMIAVIKIIKYYSWNCKKMICILPGIIIILIYLTPVVYKKNISFLDKKKIKFQVMLRSCIWGTIAGISYLLELNVEIYCSIIISFLIILIFMIIERIINVKDLNKDGIRGCIKTALEKVAVEGGGSPSLFVFYEPEVPESVKNLMKKEKKYSKITV